MPGDLTFTAQAPGVSPRTATITGTPGFTDNAGSPYTIVWTVNDGSGAANATATASTVLTISNTDRAPTLNAIANMSLAAGTTADQAISATDPDGDAITFTSSGPSFMTLTSNAQVGNTRTGNIHLAPPLGTTGTFPASVTATALAQSDTKGFTITVTAGANQQPAITAPGTASGAEGTALTPITANATDPDGAANTLTITQTGMP